MAHAVGLPARNGCGAGLRPAPGERVGRGRRARLLLLLPPRGLRAAAVAAAATAPAPTPAPVPAPALPGPAPRPRRRACRGPRAPPPRLTLKFLAVLLAAGMLAFLGAVICIIASVPLAASPARALPGGTDNASAASAAGGSGPQRSLSALHSAGGSAGPSVLPGEPAASVFPPPPVPLLSRFLCTPLAAACPSGAEQGDAAGERAELLLLQSTAEQLRQTALQQEARIRADRDTIRELTGKLGRCESGLPRGLQDAGPRRDTMADGAWDSPALLLELEDAVRALRDRIERIEVSGAPSGDTGWRGPAQPAARGSRVPGAAVGSPEACPWQAPWKCSGPNRRWEPGTVIGAREWENGVHL